MFGESSLDKATDGRIREMLLLYYAEGTSQVESKKQDLVASSFASMLGSKDSMNPRRQKKSTGERNKNENENTSCKLVNETTETGKSETGILGHLKCAALMQTAAQGSGEELDKWMKTSNLSQNTAFTSEDSNTNEPCNSSTQELPMALNSYNFESFTQEVTFEAADFGKQNKKIKKAEDPFIGVYEECRAEDSVKQIPEPQRELNLAFSREYHYDELQKKSTVALTPEVDGYQESIQNSCPCAPSNSTGSYEKKDDVHVNDCSSLIPKTDGQFSAQTCNRNENSAAVLPDVEATAKYPKTNNNLSCDTGVEIARSNEAGCTQYEPSSGVEDDCGECSMSLLAPRITLIKKLAVKRSLSDLKDRTDRMQIFLSRDKESTTVLSQSNSRTISLLLEDKISSDSGFPSLHPFISSDFSNKCVLSKPDMVSNFIGKSNKTLSFSSESLQMCSRYKDFETSNGMTNIEGDGPNEKNSNDVTVLKTVSKELVEDDNTILTTITEATSSSEVLDVENKQSRKQEKNFHGHTTCTYFEDFQAASEISDCDSQPTLSLYNANSRRIDQINEEDRDSAAYTFLSTDSMALQNSGTNVSNNKDLGEGIEMKIKELPKLYEVGEEKSCIMNINTSDVGSSESCSLKCSETGKVVMKEDFSNDGVKYRALSQCAEESIHHKSSNNYPITSKISVVTVLTSMSLGNNVLEKNNDIPLQDPTRSEIHHENSSCDSDITLISEFSCADVENYDANEKIEKTKNDTCAAFHRVTSPFSCDAVSTETVIAQQGRGEKGNNPQKKGINSKDNGSPLTTIKSSSDSSAASEYSNGISNETHNLKQNDESNSENTDRTVHLSNINNQGSCTVQSDCTYVNGKESENQTQQIKDGPRKPHSINSNQPCEFHPAPFLQENVVKEDSASCSESRTSKQLRAPFPVRRVNIPIRNLNKRNSQGETRLHLAAKKGDLCLVQSLIQAGIKVNQADYAGWTALHEASVRGHRDVMKELLEAGADVNSRGLEGVTPIHDAVSYGHYKAVKLLLQYGANPHNKNVFGMSALDSVSDGSMKELLLTSYQSSVVSDKKSPQSVTEPKKRRKPNVKCFCCETEEKSSAVLCKKNGKNPSNAKSITALLDDLEKKLNEISHRELKQVDDAGEGFNTLAKFEKAFSHIQATLNEVLIKQKAEKDDLAKKHRVTSDSSRQRILKDQLTSLASRQKRLLEILQKHQGLKQSMETEKNSLLTQQDTQQRKKSSSWTEINFCTNTTEQQEIVSLGGDSEETPSTNSPPCRDVHTKHDLNYPPPGASETKPAGTTAPTHILFLCDGATGNANKTSILPGMASAHGHPRTSGGSVVFLMQSQNCVPTQDSLTLPSKQHDKERAQGTRPKNIGPCNSQMALQVSPDLPPTNSSTLKVKKGTGAQGGVTKIYSSKGNDSVKLPLTQSQQTTTPSFTRVTQTSVSKPEVKNARLQQEGTKDCNERSQFIRLIQCGVIKPGEDVLQVKLKGSCYKASLKHDASINDGKGRIFHNPTQWIGAILGSGTPVNSSFTWNMVTYKANTLASYLNKLDPTEKGSGVSHPNFIPPPSPNGASRETTLQAKINSIMELNRILLISNDEFMPCRIMDHHWNIVSESDDWAS